MCLNGYDLRDEDDGPGSGPGATAGRSTNVSTLTWNGLALAVLAALGLIWASREPERPAATTTFDRAASSLSSVAIAPDGRTLAMARTDGALVIRDRERHRDRELEASLGVCAMSRSLAYSPDGRTLASGGRGPGVRLWDVASGALRLELGGLASPVVALAFTPDGKALASGSADGVVKLWDPAGGRELGEFAGHSEEIRSLAFSPDGRRLASGSSDGTARLWSVADGSALASLRGGGRKVYALDFAPDGRSLVMGLGASTTEMTGEVVLWYPAEGRRPFRVLGTGNVASVAFSPDGRTVAAAGGDRVVKLWDVATGREIACLAGHEGFIASLAFSPDGRTVVTGGQDSLVGHFELNPGLLPPAGHRL